MKKKKDNINIWKIVVVLSLFVNLLLFVELKISDGESSLVEDENCEELSEFTYFCGDNTYDFRLPISSFSLTSSWVGIPTDSNFEVYNRGMVLLKSTTGKGITVNYSEFNQNKMYIKQEFTVQFTEANATETRYLWYLFELSNVEDLVNFNQTFAPTIWTEEPAKRHRP